MCLGIPGRIVEIRDDAGLPVGIVEAALAIEPPGPDPEPGAEEKRDKFKIGRLWDDAKPQNLELLEDHLLEVTVNATVAMNRTLAAFLSSAVQPYMKNHDMEWPENTGPAPNVSGFLRLDR